VDRPAREPPTIAILRGSGGGILNALVVLKLGRECFWLSVEGLLVIRKWA